MLLRRSASNLHTVYAPVGACLISGVVRHSADANRRWGHDKLLKKKRVAKATNTRPSVVSNLNDRKTCLLVCSVHCSISELWKWCWCSCEEAMRRSRRHCMTQFWQLRTNPKQRGTTKEGNKFPEHRQLGEGIGLLARQQACNMWVIHCQLQVLAVQICHSIMLAAEEHGCHHFQSRFIDRDFRIWMSLWAWGHSQSRLTQISTRLREQVFSLLCRFLKD